MRVQPSAFAGTVNCGPAGGVGTDSVPGSGIVARIAQCSATAPDALAVSAVGARLTFRELFDRAVELSERLRHAGVRREDLVAVCVPRSADLVVAVLGTLAAGAGYIAIDPDQPDARLRFTLEDCSASVLVAGDDIAQRVGSGLTVVSPAASGAAVTASAVATPRPDAVAYAVYTSGSTGQPKGVLVSHAGLLNLVAWHQRAFGIGATDRATMIANPGFDAAVWEIWPTLTAGASLHIPPEDIKTDPVRLRDWLLAEQITVCFLPTPLAETIMSLPWPAEAALRWMLTGGDVLHHRPPAGLPFSLVNNYGVSEATVVSTSTVVAPGTEADSPPGIGPAIDGVQLRVLDDDGHVLPTGQDGELLICGPSVAVGYLGRPELTAAKFVTDPLNSAARAYRTGDRVRIDAGGCVEYLGRLDNQVQVRGVRVEIGEAVATVNRHPGVQASAVVPIAGADGTELVLFVVGQAEAQPAPAELRTYLADRLPAAMVPSDIRSVAALPTTSNGKIDHAALADIARAPQVAAADAIVLPRNEVQAVIAETVAALLKRPHVGVDENFFLAGGHSMLGAQLIVRIVELYGVEITLLTLFDHPTVAELAEEVERLVLDEICDMSDDELMAEASQLSAISGAES